MPKLGNQVDFVIFVYFSLCFKFDLCKACFLLEVIIFDNFSLLAFKNKVSTNVHIALTFFMGFLHSGKHVVLQEFTFISGSYSKEKGSKLGKI